MLQSFINKTLIVVKNYLNLNNITVKLKPRLLFKSLLRICPLTFITEALHLAAVAK